MTEAYFAVKVKAKADPNGNSRFGWMIQTKDKRLIDFLQDDGRGGVTLMEKYPALPESVMTFDLSINQFKFWKRSFEKQEGV